MEMASVLKTSCGPSFVEIVDVSRGGCEGRRRWGARDVVEVGPPDLRWFAQRLVEMIFAGEVLGRQLQVLLPLAGCLMPLLKGRLQMATWK